MLTKLITIMIFSSLLSREYFFSFIHCFDRRRTCLNQFISVLNVADNAIMYVLFEKYISRPIFHSNNRWVQLFIPVPNLFNHFLLVFYCIYDIVYSDPLCLIIFEFWNIHWAPIKDWIFNTKSLSIVPKRFFPKMYIIEGFNLIDIPLFPFILFCSLKDLGKQLLILKF
jgi:hypothetical protein